MAKKKSSGDYDGWILRLIDKVEDIRHSFSMGEWQAFARDKILGSGFGPTTGKLTAGQIQALEDARSQVWEVAPTRLKIQPEYIQRFRGAKTGRFMQVVKTDHGFRDIKTGRFARVSPESVERYRNLGGYGQKVGTTVSKSKINAEIIKAKADKTWARSIE